jgi:hypothetical protein
MGFADAVKVRTKDAVLGEPLLGPIRAARERLAAGLARCTVLSDVDGPPTAPQVVQAALDMLGARPFPGCIPPIAGFESLESEYRTWLEGLPTV